MPTLNMGASLLREGGQLAADNRHVQPKVVVVGNGGGDGIGQQRYIDGRGEAERELFILFLDAIIN